MKKMEKEDFKLYFDRVNQKGQFFCGCCDKEVRDCDTDEDGYTHCCNEPAVCREDFLKSGKIISIMEFLNKNTKDGYNHTENQPPFDEIIKVPSKNIEFKISLKSDIDFILNQINFHLRNV